MPEFVRRWGPRHDHTSTNSRACSRKSEATTEVDLLDVWFDAIETALRDCVCEFIQAMIEAELEAAVCRPRYGCRSKAQEERAHGRSDVSGHRHGHQPRSLIGTFGRVEISAPRARSRHPGGPIQARGRARRCRAYQRRTRWTDALIAGAYLAGTNSRRARRALAAVFGGAVSKDIVSRVSRNIKADWDAWNARALAQKPIIRIGAAKYIYSATCLAAGWGKRPTATALSAT
jgi:transposase-like protein